MFTQKEKDKSPSELRELLLIANDHIPEIDESSERRTRIERVVKDGVDLMSLDAGKPFAELESSFELVLVTLSQAFGLKPKQAAALLTNNNQYLVTACIKGAKGSNYEPVLVWYQLLQVNAVLLADLLYFEAKQLPQTARQTFFKVMAALGCGLYSYNYDVVQVVFKLIHSLFEEFMQEIELQPVAMKWFLMNQTPEDGVSGLKLVLYAIKHHQESSGSFMSLLQLLCSSNQQLVLILKEEIQTHTKSVTDYIQVISEILPNLKLTFELQLKTSGLLDFWVEVCAREAENDGNHPVEDRVAALAVLAEIWLGFTEHVDSHEEMANTILFILKRALRERTKAIRIASSALLFRILDSFGETKNKAAPVIYKSLIFALIENSGDLTTRSFYLSNFQALFQSNKGIPVQLLVEPLLKQLQTTLANGHSLKIFDFDFFVYINSHPKFSAQCALQLLEFLSRIILGDLRNQTTPIKPEPTSKPEEFPLLSYFTLAQVPFLQTCFAILLKSTGDNGPTPESQQCVNFIQQFLRQCLAKLFHLEPISRDEAFKQSLKRKEKGILGSVTQNKNASDQQRMKVLSKSSKRLEQEINRKLQKTFIVITILKIQNMLPSEAALNTELRQKTLEAQVEFKDLFGYENKGLMQILKYYGDPITLMGRHLGLNQVAIHKNQLKEYGVSKSPDRERTFKQRSVDDGLSSSVENYAVSARKPVNAIIHSSRENPLRPKQLIKQGTNDEKVYTETQQTDSHALVPYKQPSSQKDTKSRPRQRAIFEIERIQKLKEDKARAAQEQEFKQREASAKRRKLARDEVEKRKIQLGVADKVVGVPAAALIQESTDLERRQPKTKQVALIDLNDDEEDRDTKPIKHIMSQFSKLWRNLFNKYQNAGFVAKKNKSIEEHNDSVPSLSLAELNRLLRDHDTLPQLITKDELASLVRLINMKLEGTQTKSDLQSVTYVGFQQLMIQISLNCFTRPPRDLSGQPTYEHLLALISTFNTAVKARGLSTLLYEESDIPIQPKDRELISMLSAKLETEPDYPLPEGFTKVKELRPVVTYEIPTATAAVIGEARVVSVTIIDDLCAQLFGFHVLQSKVKLEEGFKVKPSFQRTPGKPEAEALEIMKKHDSKKTGASRGSFRQPDGKPAREESQSQLGLRKQSSLEQVNPKDIKPEMTPDEIAAQKAEAEAKKKKREEYKQLKAERDKRDQERQARKEEEREKKKAEEEAQRKKEERLKALKIAEQQELREKVQKFKQEREEKKKQEEDEKREAEEEEAEQKREEQEEFFAKQQERLEKRFKSLKDEKAKKNQQQAIKEQKEKEKRDKLQEKMAGHLEQGKIKRMKEQELANTMDAFLARTDIQKVLLHNDKGISTLFKYYCKQQKKESDEEIPFLMLNMHYKVFAKFAFQRKIIPRLATVEDVNKTFRDIVRYYKDAQGSGSDNSSKFTNYIDYQMFQRALVRIALIGKDTEQASELEQATTEANQQLRDEFAKEAGKDQDFDQWLAGKETKGQGLKAKLAQMKRFAGKRVRATSVTKQNFVDVDINTLTAADLQNLCTILGIKENGEIEEKSLEEKQQLSLENFGSTSSKNTLGRLNMKQQSKPDSKQETFDFLEVFHEPKSTITNESGQPKEVDNDLKATSEIEVRKEEDQVETKQQ